MKILLIDPIIASGLKGYKPPLGLMYIASMLLKEGHEVRIMDNPDQTKQKRTFLDLIVGVQKEFAPALVGISSITPTYLYGLEIATQVKRINRNVFVVIGGPHPSIFPEEAINNPQIDAVIRGEGEYSMLELVNALEERRSLLDIKGVSFKQDGRIIHNPPRHFIADLDTLPFPARHLLPFESYSAERVLLISSRGCPFNCCFCFQYEKRWRGRSPANIVQEIEEIMARFGQNNFIFDDDDFTFDRKRVENFCDILIERGLHKKIKWSCLSRVDQVDKKLLLKMKEAGCISVEYGIESGDPDILKRIHKNITLEQVRQAIRLTKEAGLKSKTYFMLGFPWDTRETIARTVAFAKELNSPLNSFCIATPYPGTELWQYVNKDITYTDISMIHVGNKNINLNIPRYFDLKDITYEEIAELLNYAHIQSVLMELGNNPLRYFLKAFSVLHNNSPMNLLRRGFVHLRTKFEYRDYLSKNRSKIGNNPKRFFEEYYRGGDWNQRINKVDLIRNKRIAQLVSTLGTDLRILDLGCGKLISKLISHYNTVYGLDISTIALKEAKSYTKAAICGDLERPLPFKDNVFDLVIYVNALYYLRNPLFSLREIVRILKPQGKLILVNSTLANDPSIWWAYFKMNLIKREGFIIKTTNNLAWYDHKYFSFQIYNMLKKTGFKIIHKFPNTFYAPFLDRDIYPKKIYELGKLFPIFASSVIILAKPLINNLENS